jgi:hypothetical protein
LRFLARDPDVIELMKDPEFRHAGLVQLIMLILTTENVEACRKTYGREFVNSIFAMAKDNVSE